MKLPIPTPKNIGYFLYFDTKDVVKLIKREIKDGTVDIDGKSFVLDETQPKIYNTKFGFKPLYLVKWDNVAPIIIKDGEIKSSEITPEMLRKLINMKILGNMIKTSKPMPSFFLLIAGLVIGVLVMFSMHYLGVF